jgi:hypothetical protein
MKEMQHTLGIINYYSVVVIKSIMRACMYSALVHLTDILVISS